MSTHMSQNCSGVSIVVLGEIGGSAKEIKWLDWKIKKIASNEHDMRFFLYFQNVLLVNIKLDISGCNRVLHFKDEDFIGPVPF